MKQNVQTFRDCIFTNSIKIKMLKLYYMI